VIIFYYQRFAHLFKWVWRTEDGGELS